MSRVDCRRARAAVAGALAALFAAGCAFGPGAEPGTTARWEKQLGLGRPDLVAQADRRLADTAPTCLKDRLASTEFIRQEALRAEAASGKNPVSGEWQGKDLSALPPAQGRFMLDNSRWIATESVDPARCSDVPCILNQVYGPDASSQGWRIYHFYLMMGYSVSCRDFVPGDSLSYLMGQPSEVKTPAALSAHLFSEAELAALSRLVYLLPEKYRQMRSLQRLHRVPTGYRMPGWKKTTCGDYVSFYTSNPSRNFFKEGGFIRFARCMETEADRTDFSDEPNASRNGLGGDLYRTVAHEMSHALDRSLGPSGATLDRLSGGADWRDLSGWYRETTTMPKADFAKKFPGQDCERRDGSEEGTCIVMTWKKTPGKEGFVRAYAGETPGEDFAETAAWLRFRPVEAAKQSPRKVAFLSARVFDGRTYDDAGLSRYYWSAAAARVRPQLPALVDGCMGGNGEAGPTVPAASARAAEQLSLDPSLPPSIVSCIVRALHARTTEAFNELKGAEWEACDHIGAHDPELRANVFASLAADVSRFVARGEDRAPLIRAQQQLRALLASTDHVDPREGYIHCHRQARPEECYAQALKDRFDRIAQPYAQALGEELERERADFVKRNPFSQARNQAEQFYRGMLVGIEPSVAAMSETRWKACLAAEDAGAESGALLVKPYTGGSHFVAAQLLNCLNRAVAGDVQAVRDRYVSHFGLSVIDADAQAWIDSLILPGYLDALRSRQDAAIAEEERERASRKPGVIDVLFSELAGNLGWMGEAGAAESATSLCVSAAGAAFDRYFARVSQEQRLPTRFAAIEDLRADWSREACARVLATPAATRNLDARSAAAWTNALSALEKAVASRARDRGQDCRARYAGDSRRPPACHLVSHAQYLLCRQRKECLTGAAAWSQIEALALAERSQTPEGARYVSRRAEAEKHLERKRATLKAAAVDAMNALSAE